ncbi:MAG: hypothetical protein AB7S78_07380 [Candidatus Omnitrophota bacterium]
MRLQNKLWMAGLILLLTTSAHAASYQKSEFDRVTPWNKITDYAATLGKSKTEKKSLLHQRKADRRKERIQKARAKAKKEQADKYKSSYIRQ